jgi:hypothetical protein
MNTRAESTSRFLRYRVEEVTEVILFASWGS